MHWTNKMVGLVDLAALKYRTLSLTQKSKYLHMTSKCDFLFYNCSKALASKHFF
jgi:hypothetical protein